MKHAVACALRQIGMTKHLALPIQMLTTGQHKAANGDSAALSPAWIKLYSMAAPFHIHAKPAADQAALSHVTQSNAKLVLPV